MCNTTGIPRPQGDYPVVARSRGSEIIAVGYSSLFCAVRCVVPAILSSNQGAAMCITNVMQITLWLDCIRGICCPHASLLTKFALVFVCVGTHFLLAIPSRVKRVPENDRSLPTQSVVTSNCASMCCRYVCARFVLLRIYLKL